MFFFGDFSIYLKDWLTYSVGNNRPSELCYKFGISNDLTQMVYFPTWLIDVTVTGLLFWIYLFSMTLVFYNVFPSNGKFWSCCCLSFHNFPINSKQDALLHCIAYDYSYADWNGLRDHLRDVTREDIFKLSASAEASEFCEWVQVRIDVYIPHQMYQGQTSLISMVFTFCCCHSW